MADLMRKDGPRCGSFNCPLNAVAQTKDGVHLCAAHYLVAQVEKATPEEAHRLDAVHHEQPRKRIWRRHMEVSWEFKPSRVFDKCAAFVIVLLAVWCSLGIIGRISDNVIELGHQWGWWESERFCECKPQGTEAHH